ncbi:catalase-like domain-containing protein [Mycotypha africana]|uniref:catalase-like domain-containing protein n=1 Tax=Mycotypha africana TaxID=64632 RepID=UPI0022FFDD2B|nr:catalase-like domain-containing protein [Mycotypha africana]KAI8975560.1 catalase-like domain-containing protein [Mycotypha africana]
MKAAILKPFISLFLAAQLVAAKSDKVDVDADSKSAQLENYSVSDAGFQEMTQFGVKINNSDSLKAGLDGPALMEDFMMREKIMHFDHERIPERAVHARGVGLHGYFESYGDYSNITAASFLRGKGKKTPMFVRISTVLGSRGSPDTVRDVHGFAIRFYTDEGNFDIVGNNVAPFFVHDAIKFPDLIHAAKPHPNTEVPQAGTAHETAYDFFAEFPESLNTVLWALSGRGIPNSIRQIEGFGVHTYRLITEEGKSRYCKFIWKPKQGLSNLLWDEAQKLAGKNIDHHRTDIYTSIDNGDYPEWEFGVQIIEEEDFDKFDFSLLDPTKFVPESLVPFQPLGKITLNRNPDNYFAEVEQVTFHPGHAVRGVGFTNDPLLQGRLFSYLDTQLNRMSGPNYMQLPINRPLGTVHNNQRDGYMQMNIHKGEVAYFPNRLQGNTPSVVDGDKGGYIEYPEKINNVTKVRGRSAKFFDFYSQPRLYWNSLTAHEKQQLVDGARFEIGASTSFDVRKRMVKQLNLIDNELARRVAYGIGVPLPEKEVENDNKTSVGLSIANYPKDQNIKTRTVAILVAPGTNIEEAKAMYEFLKKEGAYPAYIGLNMGEQDGLKITTTYRGTHSVQWDAVYVPGGNSLDIMTSRNSFFPFDEPRMFVAETFRHAKPIAASAEGAKLLQYADIELPELKSGFAEKDGVVVAEKVDDLEKPFKEALIKQRHWERLPLDPEI